MGFLSEIKQNTAGTIAALQTVLERYPVLITADENLGKTSISFMLNLLKMFGVTEEDIIEWLSKLLADKKDGTDGLLTVIEAAIKTILIASFKETYTCYVDPIIPDDILYDVYESKVRGNGIDIKIEDIDNFGLLRYCPTDDTIGNYFYFDNNRSSGYTPSTMYLSTDFNAYLWYVINKGTQINEGIHKCVWDNRVYYRGKFEREGCLNGEENGLKYDFISTYCDNSPLQMVKGVGPKMEILHCEFKEDTSGNYLKVRLNPHRYAPDLIGVSLLPKRKTVFQFNVDYITSLKLFDTKTLIAQVVNALLGITASLEGEFSIERNILSKQVRQIVKNIIEEEDTQEINDCYYSFSNDKYEAMMEEAMLNYNGEYQSKNETNENIPYDAEEVMKELYSIESAENLNEESSAITRVIKYVSSTLSTSEEIGKESKFNFELSIIQDFIEEVMTEIIMQVLTPKIMLLFAINEHIMNNDGENKMSGIIAFFKNFQNLIIELIKKIKDLILQALYDFLMGQIKPLITIFIQKLLLETIYYYKILIQSLIENCTIDFSYNSNRDPLSIDNVVGADIIPSQNRPISEENCRTE